VEAISIKPKNYIVDPVFLLSQYARRDGFAGISPRSPLISFSIRPEMVFSYNWMRLALKVTSQQQITGVNDAKIPPKHGI
jgi:hypothetical protein